jgi:hypothetical protein
LSIFTVGSSQSFIAIQTGELEVDGNSGRVMLIDFELRAGEGGRRRA